MHRDTRLESGSKVCSTRLRPPRTASRVATVLPLAGRFTKSPKITVADAMALVLSYGETRLYHDRFNFSGCRHFQDTLMEEPGGRIVRISCILVVVVLLSLRQFAEAPWQGIEACSFYLCTGQ